MNLLSKLAMCLASVCIILPLSYAECPSGTVLQARALLLECVAAMPVGDSGTPEHIMEFGLVGAVKNLLPGLGVVVSNDIASVYQNFSEVATNTVERRLLLASSWRLGDDYYLDCLSRNVDLAIEGTISADDLCWYMRGHRTRHLTYLLASEYDRPGVSNIVLRLIAYTGETNKYEKVLSGEAKAEYLEFEQFMADGPEAPRQEE